MSCPLDNRHRGRATSSTGGCAAPLLKTSTMLYNTSRRLYISRAQRRPRSGGTRPAARARPPPGGEGMSPVESPRQQWYVAALSREVSRDFLSRWILDEPVCFYRTL